MTGKCRNHFKRRSAGDGQATLTVEALLSVGDAPINSTLDRAELAAWMSVTRTLINLHETITRNHRCSSIEELLGNVYTWANTQANFYLQTASFRATYALAA